MSTQPLNHAELEAEALAAFRTDANYAIEMAGDACRAAEKDERVREQKARNLERGRIRRAAARAAAVQSI